MSNNESSEMPERFQPKHDEFKDVNIHELELALAKTVSDFMKEQYDCEIEKIKYGRGQDKTIITASFSWSIGNMLKE